MNDPAPEELCACGKPLHYSDPRVRAEVERAIAAVGPTVDITCGAKSYRVQRHYLALHGIASADLERLAAAGTVQKIPFAAPDPADPSTFVASRAFLRAVMDDMLYVLDDAGEPRPELNLLRWGEWMSKGGRTLRLTRFGTDAPEDPEVSTVFLGMNHQFAPGGPPVLWETMVFWKDGPAEWDGHMLRYTSRESALAGHAEICGKVQEAWKARRRLEGGVDA